MEQFIIYIIWGKNLKGAQELHEEIINPQKVKEELNILFMDWKTQNVKIAILSKSSRDSR